MIIYKITNILNKKFYIGATTRSDISKRWKEHIRDSKENRGNNTYLYKAIRKYGIENFIIEIIVSNINNKEELFYCERYLIRYYECNKRNIGYNLTDGGECNFSTTGENHHNYGKKNDTFTKLNKSRIGIPLSNGQKEKIGIGNKGKIKTQSSKDLIAEAVSNSWLNNNHNRTKSIICNETGEIFKSIADAAFKFRGNRRAKQISYHLLGKGKTAYGFTFSYINN